MNLVICIVVAVIFTNHLTESTVPPWQRQAAWYPLQSSHHVARRHSPYWFRMERAFRDAGLSSADFYDQQRRLRKNRNAGDVFAVDDMTAAMSGLEQYPQQTQPRDVFSSPVADTFFGEEMSKLTNQGEPLDVSAAINFGTHDLLKMVRPHHNRRPPCKTDNAKRPASDAPAVDDGDIHHQAAQDSTIWTPLVNETECQSYGSSMFCEKVANYPEEKVKELLSTSNGSLLTTFFSDNIPAEAPPMTQASDVAVTFAINTRIRPSTDIVNLCDSKTDYIFPKSARNKNDEMLMIVNQDNISQPITVETCRSENTPCHYAENFPAGHKAVCMQKYVTHHLAAVKNGKIVREAFTFPSCCVCVVKQPLLERANIAPAAMASRRMLSSPTLPSSATGNEPQSQ